MNNENVAVKKQTESGASKVKRFITHPRMAILLVFIGLCIIFSLLSPVFFTPANALNIARQIVVTGLLAIGMTFVIISGEIDLSVGSIVGFTGMVIAIMFTNGVNIVLVILLLLGMGLGIGLLNGFLVTRVRLPAFLATLSTTLIFRGFAMATTPGSVPMSMSNDTFNQIFAQATLGGFFPTSTIILIILVVVGIFLLNKTVFGKHVYAVGGSAEAANLAGINVKKVKMLVFMISGFCAAVCGGVYAARIGAAITTGGEGFEMDAIAAVVLGGTKFSGGSGNILGTVFGALIICVISNALTLMSVPTAWRLVVQGVIIIIAVAIDVFMKRDD